MAESSTDDERTERSGVGSGEKQLTISVSELLSILLSSFKLIVLSATIAVLVGIIVCLVQTPLFLAQATVLPQEPYSRMSGFAVGATDRFSRLQLGGRTSQNYHATILRSAALAEAVSRRLGYADWYQVRGGQSERERRAVLQLKRSVTITQESGLRFYASGGGLVTVLVGADDPVQVADIANTYVYALDEHLSESSVTSASRLRRFLERRLEEINRELEEAQRNLQEFQEEHGAVSINEQAAATIDLLSELEARRVGYAVEKVATEERYSAAHSSVRMLQAKIDAVQEVIDRLTYSQEEKVPYEREGQVKFFVPLKTIPELSFEASRRLLTLKSKEGIVQLFVQRLEQAKIDEASNLPTVSVLDLAHLGRKVRPNWTLNLPMALVIGLLVGCMAAWGGHYGRLAFEGAEEGSSLKTLERQMAGIKQTVRGRTSKLTPRSPLTILLGESQSYSHAVCNFPSACVSSSTEDTEETLKGLMPGFPGLQEAGALDPPAGHEEVTILSFHG